MRPSRFRIVYILFLVAVGFMLLMSASYKNHKNVYDGVIKFNGIEWGTSLEEIREAHPEYRIRRLTNGRPGDRYTNLGIVKDVADSQYDNVDLLCCFIGEPLEVAGYTTTDTTLHFACSKGGDEALFAGYDTALYAARYELNPTDAETVGGDLRGKLRSLYGDIDSTDEWESGHRQRRQDEWYGQGGSRVTLTVYRDTEDVGDNRIWITYYTKHGNKLLKMAQDSVFKRMAEDAGETQDRDNRDGL
jgi:hypothetical protein